MEQWQPSIKITQQIIIIIINIAFRKTINKKKNFNKKKLTTHYTNKKNNNFTNFLKRLKKKYQLQKKHLKSKNP
jgi:hypothetical protein